MACEDTVVVQWTMSGTHTGPFLVPGGQVLEGTGQRIAVRGNSVRTLENGLILTHSIYYDQLELLARLAPLAPLAPMAALAPLAPLREVHAESPTGSQWTKRWQSARFL